MEQGLIDIRNKACELSKKFGSLSPYNISCSTLIAIINELEASQKINRCECCGAKISPEKLCSDCDQPK